MKKALIAAIALSAIAAAAQADTYTLDPNHTFVTFEVKHNGTSTVRGRFDKKEGSVTTDPAAKTGKVEVTIDTTSVSTGVAALDTHLKGKEFFDTEKFPTAKFVSDDLTYDGTKVADVSGMLTMRGKTLPVKLTATNFNCYDSQQLKRPVCGGDFETTIERSQWGVSYGLQYGLPDAVHLLVQVEAVKQ